MTSGYEMPRVMKISALSVQQKSVTMDESLADRLIGLGFRSRSWGHSEGPRLGRFTLWVVT